MSAYRFETVSGSLEWRFGGDCSILDRLEVVAAAIIFARDPEQLVQVTGDEALFGQQAGVFEFFDIGEIAQGGEAETASKIQAS
jgi:hypothetical protein